MAYWPRMDRDALRAYARRGWDELEKLKRAHWAETVRGQGPEVAFRAAAELADYMRRVRPDWPSREERSEDLHHHVALKERIDRAAWAFTAR